MARQEHLERPRNGTCLLIHKAEQPELTKATSHSKSDSDVLCLPIKGASTDDMKMESMLDVFERKLDGHAVALNRLEYSLEQMSHGLIESMKDNNCVFEKM